MAGSILPFRARALVLLRFLASGLQFLDTRLAKTLRDLEAGMQMGSWEVLPVVLQSWVRRNHLVKMAAIGEIVHLPCQAWSRDLDCSLCDWTVVSNESA